jgi:hypothetical protein
MNILRVGLTAAALALAVCFLASAASAKNDVSVRIDAGQGGLDYSYDWQSFWGGPVLFGELGYSRNGRMFGQGNGGWQDPSGFYSPFGSSPNDRGGYRAFIPRGLEYPPQYYGDAQNPAPIQPGRRQHHNPYGYYQNYPTVIPYSYGYSYYGNPAVVYTAPSCQEYGYYRPQQLEYQPPAVNNYDNRVYNNYYGYPPQGAPAPAQPQYQPPPAPVPFAKPTAPQPPAQDFIGPLPPALATPPAPAPGTPSIPAGYSYGLRFYDQTRLSAPDGEFRCVLKDGKLTGSDAAGQGYTISTAADMRFGAFAAYEPVAGFSVIFREGESLLAAYPVGGGEWWLEPLPYKVDFRQDITVGMIGGQPWVVFGALDGRRYVISFGGRQWQEVGSGSRPKP